MKTIADGDTLWTKTFGGEYSSIGYSVQQTIDRGYIITGCKEYDNKDVWLIKTDANGDTVWTKTYGKNKNDYGFSLKQTTDGGYIIIGSTESDINDRYDFWLLKTDSLGDTLWTKIFGGSGQDIGNSVLQTRDGGYFVLGNTTSFDSIHNDIWLIKTDLNGDTLWTKTFGGSDSEYGYKIEETIHGYYIILGSTKSYGAGLFDIWLIMIDEEGDTLWTKTFGGIYDDYGTSIIQTIDGGFIITGHTKSFGAGDADFYLIRTNSSVDTLWTNTYGGTETDYGVSTSLISGMGFMMVGCTKSFGAGGNDIYIIRVDTLTIGIQDDNPFNFLNPNNFIVSYNNNNLISIRYSIQHSSSVNLSMYNISGQLVKTFFNEYKNAGDHTINFNTDNISAGVYYFKLSIGQSSYTQKAVVVK